MLNKETHDSLKKSIKEINKEKSVNVRIDKARELRHKVQNDFNEIMDDYLAEVNMTVKKIELNESDYLN
jgi:hypothetical protein